MDIKDKAQAQATRMLDAAGCEYIIKTRTGEIVTRGSLELAPAKPERVRTRRVAPGTYINIYRAPIDKLAVGDSWTYECSADQDVVGLRAAAASYVSDKFGPGNAMTSIDRARRTVEVLRLA